VTPQEQSKEIYRRMVNEVVNQGHFEVVEELFHPDYVDHAAPPGAPGGLEGVKAIFGMFRTAFPDVVFRIDDMAHSWASRRRAYTRRGARSDSSA
jgi:predicted SnoaL-like aldol condensation-catalyzing enzyme